MVVLTTTETITQVVMVSPHIKRTHFSRVSGYADFNAGSYLFSVAAGSCMREPGRYPHITHISVKYVGAAANVEFRTHIAMSGAATSSEHLYLDSFKTVNTTEYHLLFDGDLAFAGTSFPTFPMAFVIVGYGATDDFYVTVLGYWDDYIEPRPGDASISQPVYLEGYKRPLTRRY